MRLTAKIAGWYGSQVTKKKVLHVEKLEKVVAYRTISQKFVGNHANKEITRIWRKSCPFVRRGKPTG